MRFVIYTLMLVIACGSSNAHELTPTYPELTPYIYAGILRTTMTAFNRREDVSYYQIEVYDSDWKPVPFASEHKVMKLEYLERKSFDVYFRKIDESKVVYICTRSKILKGEENSLIASNICSKVK